MPDIKFDHIVSCSSEDPHHPASNLLKPETYRKWRCEKAGEEKATVIIQLEKETLIHTIDIGNNGSFTVEVLVGKSSSSEANYEVLLQASSFMTPNESKSMEQMNRVRMFSMDKFCPDIAKKKWDRIMVRCTQPWGCHQYGLSFIALHSPPEEEEATASKLGRFVLKDEVQDDIRPGSLFARWKENKDSSPQRPRTAAAAIAEASSPSSLAAMEASKTKAAKIVPKKREHTNGSSPDSKRHNGTQSPSSSKKPEEKAPKDNRKALERDTPPPESPPPADSPPRKAKSPPPAKKATPVTKKAPKKATTPKVKKPEKPKVRRPFNQLMKDVTFVLSGFQNPLRANLREQALDMGARYQGDWNSSCTHLVCAFANTPKARQVRGKGKIVKKEWIEHCHRERKLFPWRRYALDQQDGDENESEEEIWEQVNEPEASTSQASSNNQFSVDTDDEDIAQVPPAPKATEGDAYDADTDVDSDSAVLADLPALPDVFTGKNFAIHEDLAAEDKAQLKRYIVGLGGKVKDDLDPSVNYLVTETTDGLDALEQCYPDVTPIIPDWIWKCTDAGKLLPESDFKLEAST